MATTLSLQDYELVLEAGCCLAAIDGRLTRYEIDIIANVLVAAGAPQSLVTTENILGAARRAHRDGATLASTRVREQLMWSRTLEVRTAINRIYDALKTSAPAETERLARIMDAISPPYLPNQEDTQMASEASGSKALDGLTFRSLAVRWFAWREAYLAWAPLALIVMAIRFRLELSYRAGNLTGLRDGQRAVLAILSGITVYAAMGGLFSGYRMLQNTHGGAVVPPAIAFCVCLYVLWWEWFV